MKRLNANGTYDELDPQTYRVVGPAPAPPLQRAKREDVIEPESVREARASATMLGYVMIAILSVVTTLALYRLVPWAIRLVREIAGKN